MHIAEEVAKKLLQIKAIKLSPHNPYRWASGMQSPIYCDNRVLLSYPDTRDFIKNALTEKSLEFGDFDVVAGVATAGIAHGALLADLLRKPFVYVRSKAKEHGRQNLIEGELRAGQKVLVVEDLISTGESSIQVVQVLRDSDCTVAGVLAIFSYELDVAGENFAKANCRLKSLSNYTTLLSEATKANYISHDEHQVLLEWRKNPAGWATLRAENH